MKLHHVLYKVDKDFKENVENLKKTMSLFSNNADVKKNVDKLVQMSKASTVPVARLDCWYETNKL